MRKYGRVDKVHGDIVAALRKAGCFVLSLSSIGNGCPDLLVIRKKKMALCELKTGTNSPSQQRLTPDQERFIKDCQTTVFKLTSIDDAIKLANVMGVDVQ